MKSKHSKFFFQACAPEISDRHLTVIFGTDRDRISARPDDLERRARGNAAF